METRFSSDRVQTGFSAGGLPLHLKAYFLDTSFCFIEVRTNVDKGRN